MGPHSHEDQAAGAAHLVASWKEWLAGEEVGAAVRALSAYEARRLAKLLAGCAGSDGSLKYNCSKVDCARLLIDYSPAGTHADLVAQPTARLFRMSAFGWDGRAALGFFRSSWSAEASGARGKEAWPLAMTRLKRIQKAL